MLDAEQLHTAGSDEPEEASSCTLPGLSVFHHHRRPFVCPEASPTPRIKDAGTGPLGQRPEADVSSRLQMDWHLAWHAPWVLPPGPHSSPSPFRDSVSRSCFWCPTSGEIVIWLESGSGCEGDFVQMAPDSADVVCLHLSQNSPETGLTGSALHPLLSVLPAAHAVSLRTHPEVLTAPRSCLHWQRPQKSEIANAACLVTCHLRFLQKEA